MRDGVSASCVSLPPGPWPLLLDFLAERFDRLARQTWAERMARGDVFDAQGRALPVTQAYAPHGRVYYFRAPPPELPIPFEERVLYRDAHLLVADKPHFLPVQPSGRYLQETLLVRLKHKLDLPALVPLHRIDRDTAGLVLFSLNPASRGAYAALFRERRMRKQYEAIAPWRAGLVWPLQLHNRVETSDCFMTMAVVPGEANAETHISVLERQGDWARYALAPVTGRRHQLRVQMADLGLPIRHDQMYPVLTPECAPGSQPDFSQPLQLLARGLEFEDPLSGETRRFESGLRLALP